MWRYNKSQTLAKKRADIRAENENGDTPLHLAAFYDKIEMVQSLLEQGADICAKNKNDDTPLHEAAQKGYIEIIKLFLNYEVDADRFVEKYPQYEDLVEQVSYGGGKALKEAISEKQEIPEEILKSSSSHKRKREDKEDSNLADQTENLPLSDTNPNKRTKTAETEGESLMLQIEGLSLLPTGELATEDKTEVSGANIEDLD